MKVDMKNIPCAFLKALLLVGLLVLSPTMALAVTGSLWIGGSEVVSNLTNPGSDTGWSWDESAAKLTLQNGYSGALVQEVADDKYFDDPVSADIRNLRILRRYIDDKEIQEERK